MRAQTPEPVTGPRERLIDVVVVANDRRSLEMLTSLLEADGCLVRAATTVEAAEAVLGERVPDVFVTDLDLDEGPTGEVLAERIRHDARLRHVVLIALSGRADQGQDVVRGFDAYLRKPIDVTLLVELVRQLAVMNRGQTPGEVAAG